MLEYEHKPVYAINLSLASIVCSYLLGPNPKHDNRRRTKGVSAKLISCEHIRAASAISMAYRAAGYAGDEGSLLAQMSDAVIEFQSRVATKRERTFDAYKPCVSSK